MPKVKWLSNICNFWRINTLDSRLVRFLILIVVLSLPHWLSAQGFTGLTSLQTGFGTPVPAYSARSLSLGGVGIACQTTPDALVVNPALMVWGSGAAEVLLSGTISRQQESRSYPVYDSFDAILVYNQYAMNDHLFSEANGAVRFTVPQNLVPAVALGVGTFAYYTHDYRYKEEVRDRYASGGVVDRVLGWNKIEMDGEVRAILLGAAVEPIPNLAVGLNAGAVLDNLGNTWSVDYTNPDSSDFYVRENLETDAMEWIATFGCAYRLSPRVTLGLRSVLPLGDWEMIMEREVPIQMSSSYTSDVVYKYPLSVGWGVQYRPMSLHRPALMLDMIWTNWSAAEIGGESTNYDDVLEIHAGVEHRVFENIPVRLGCSYVPSYLDRELTMTMISLGTGFQAGAFRLDVATNFGRRQYRLDDAFPDHYYGGVDRTDRDQVEERIMNGMVSVTYTF
jgi:hypothetical protein